MSIPRFAWLLVAAHIAAAAHADDSLSKPIRVSADGHYLTHSGGSPFFWLGDTAWSIFTRLNREETERYLIDRTDKGFNVIQAVAVGGPLDDLTVPNRYGELSLIDRDFRRPNPKYFEHIDWVVAEAGRRGIRIAMLPVWSLLQITSNRAIDVDTAKTYGRWIAERYRNKGVIWVLGGDTVPMWDKRGLPTSSDTVRVGGVSIVDDRPIYDAMAQGIIEGDGGDPFITFHPTNLSFSGTAHPRTSLYFHDREWLDMNMLQSSHFIDPSAHLKFIGADFSWIAPLSYQPIGDEYRSSPTRPIIDGEPRFEDLAIDLDRQARRGYWSGYDARTAAYQSVFAGAAGHTYGNHSIWQFFENDKKRAYQLPRETVPWQIAMTRRSAGQLKHLSALMLSRPYFTRIPDQSIIVGEQGQGMSHIAATRDKQGRYAFIYLPQGQPVTVDMSKISGLNAAAWWFDPRSGTSTAIDEILPNNGFSEFIPPVQGMESDWVLVLDDQDKRYNAPGARSQLPSVPNSCALH